MIARVKKLDTKISAKGTEYLHVTMQAGDKDYTYNVFDRALMTTLQQAEEKDLYLKVVTKAEGKFTNLVGAILVPEPIGPSVIPADQTVPRTENKTINDADRYRAMAMSYSKDGWCAGKISTDQLTEFADFFYAYITQIHN